MKLDADAKELLESVERELRGSDVSRDRRLNIRLSSKDLEAIQKRALAEGLPYQTPISSVLHKYASGRLKEIRVRQSAVASSR
jgi:predicted DNA binding CopG/RHH family protein